MANQNNTELNCHLSDLKEGSDALKTLFKARMILESEIGKAA